MSKCLVCDTCGSSNDISVDAWLHWDKEKQDWRVAPSFSGPHNNLVMCSSPQCDGDFVDAQWEPLVAKAP
jgi:hypothetical protein